MFQPTNQIVIYQMVFSQLMNIDGSFHGYFTHSLIAIICFIPLEIAIQYDLWLFIPFAQSHKKQSKTPSKNRGSLVQATLPNSLRPKSWPFPYIPMLTGCCRPGWSQDLPWVLNLFHGHINHLQQNFQRRTGSWSSRSPSELSGHSSVVWTRIFLDSWFFWGENNNLSLNLSPGSGSSVSPFFNQTWFIHGWHGPSCPGERSIFTSQSAIDQGDVFFVHSVRTCSQRTGGSYGKKPLVI